MTLTSVAVQNNKSAVGGGIYVNAGKLTLNSDIINNKNKAGSGGGILINGGTVKMSKGAISMNTATTSGPGLGITSGGGGIFVTGGSLTLTNVPITSNTSNFDGGGIDIRAGTVKVTGGKVSGNLAGGNRGGGIWTGGGNLTLNGTANNPVSILNNTAANQGGGLYLATGSTTTFASVLVDGNKANGFGNGLGPANGPGVYWQTNATVNPNPPNPPALTDNDDPNGPMKGR